MQFATKWSNAQFDSFCSASDVAEDGGEKASRRFNPRSIWTLKHVACVPDFTRFVPSLTL